MPTALLSTLPHESYLKELPPLAALSFAEPFAGVASGMTAAGTIQSPADEALDIYRNMTELAR